VGGLFREQGVDVVKRWLDPLFEPHVDAAYWTERGYHLPEPAAPATPSPTPSPSPPPQCVAPSPCLPGRAAEGLNQVNVNGCRRSEETTAPNRPMQFHSLVAGASPWAIDGPSGGRTRRGIGSRDGGRGDAGKYARTSS